MAKNTVPTRFAIKGTHAGFVPWAQIQSHQVSHWIFTWLLHTLARCGWLCWESCRKLSKHPISMSQCLSGSGHTKSLLQIHRVVQILSIADLG